MSIGLVLLVLATAQGMGPDESPPGTPLPREIKSDVSRQETAAPEYPIDAVPLPCAHTACGSVTLVDFSVGLTQDGDTDQDVAARVRIGDRAFAGGRAGPGHQSIRLTTHRIGLGFDQRDDTVGFHGSYRAPRLLLEGRTDRRGDEDGRGWSSELQAAIRFGPDFEILVGGAKSSGPRPTSFLVDSQLERVSGGFIWQRDLAFEISTEASFARIDSGGRQFDRDRVGTSLVYYQSRGVRLHGDLAYEWDTGFIPNTIRTTGLGVQAHIGTRLVAHAASVRRSDLDLGLVKEDYRAGLTLFARRHSFDRGGESAERTLDLARRATALGYNERRVHTLNGRRTLRERLSLSANRRELADEIDALYQAQVRDRNVPHLGFEWVRQRDPVFGVVRDVFDVFAGLPWRPRWPFLTGHDPVDFLVVRYARIENDFIESSYEQQYRVEVALNRETNVVFAWIDPEQTRLDDALNHPVSQRWEARLVHRLGR